MDIKQRLSKIFTMADIEREEKLAAAYVKRLHTESKKLKSLADKIEHKAKAKLAETTLRQLRLMSFDIEDALKAGKSLLELPIPHC